MQTYQNVLANFVKQSIIYLNLFCLIIFTTTQKLAHNSHKVSNCKMHSKIVDKLYQQTV